MIDILLRRYFFTSFKILLFRSQHILCGLF